MKMRYLLMLVPLLALGCAGAGSGYQLLGYDAIAAAAVEAKKGLAAYDGAARTAIAADRAEYLGKLHVDVVRIALSAGETQATAENLATTIVANTKLHFETSNRQDQLRAQWYAVTLGNLQYIIDTAGDAKAFEVYRSNIGQQWKQYLNTVARSRLKTMKGVSNVPDATTPGP